MYSLERPLYNLMNNIYQQVTLMFSYKCKSNYRYSATKNLISVKWFIFQCYLYLWAIERERERVCVWVREWVRERERVYESEKVWEWESVGARVRECGSEGEIEREFVCVEVLCEREKKCACVRMCCECEIEFVSVYEC